MGRPWSMGTNIVQDHLCCFAALCAGALLRSGLNPGAREPSQLTQGRLNLRLPIRKERVGLRPLMIRHFPGRMPYHQA